MNQSSRFAYKDCYELMDKALESPTGIKVRIDGIAGWNHAWRLRLRLHSARRIDRKDNAIAFPEIDHPMHGRSEYDTLYVTLDRGEACTWLKIQKIDALKYEVHDIEEKVDGESISLAGDHREPEAEAAATEEDGFKKRY